MQKLANKGSASKNAARDLKKFLFKHSDMPNLYYSKILLWDKDEMKQIEEDFPVLLPHEVLAKVADQVADPYAEFGQVKGKQMNDLKNSLCSKLNISADHFIPLGLHGDGVPHQKSKSVEWKRTGAANVGARAGIHWR
eukprot:6745493-Alexandrium_andersonii.AAC.1